jgi:pyruvate/2-oxoglutarate dehydrogenase complex dihydrolipoamide acyltransferase (E2) component
MATEVQLPALSPTMTEGKIVKWLKKVGEEHRKAAA